MQLVVVSRKLIWLALAGAIALDVVTPIIEAISNGCSAPIAVFFIVGALLGLAGLVGAVRVYRRDAPRMMVSAIVTFIIAMVGIIIDVVIIVSGCGYAWYA
jgi:hypothetical protein